MTGCFPVTQDCEPVPESTALAGTTPANAMAIAQAAAPNCRDLFIVRSLVGVTGPRRTCATSAEQLTTLSPMLSDLGDRRQLPMTRLYFRTMPLYFRTTLRLPVSPFGQSLVFSDCPFPILALAASGVVHWLAPRGLAQVADRFAEQEGVAITGSAAARGLLPPEKTSVVPLRLLALYAASPRRHVRQLGLVEPTRRPRTWNRRPPGRTDPARPW